MRVGEAEVKGGSVRVSGPQQHRAELPWHILPLAALILGWGAASVAYAADLVQIVIQARYPRAVFRVDGQPYIGQATFLWPLNSTHVLEFEVIGDGYQYESNGRVRYRFKRWVEASGKTSWGTRLVQVLVAEAAFSPITLDLDIEYQVRLQVAGGGYQPSRPDSGCVVPGPSSPGEYRPGIVLLNGRCYDGDTVVWLPPGELVLEAYPYPGFAFTGWGIGGSSLTGQLQILQLSTPLDIVANFQPARRVRFLTDPPGLKLIVDQSLTPTPLASPCDDWQRLPVAPPPGVEPLCVGEFDWPVGSRHTIAALSPQDDLWGRTWVFQSFSNGMSNPGVYEVDALTPPHTIVARFVRGARLSLLTQPVGLKLEINGRSNWPAYNFVAAPGEIFRIRAPSEQLDAQGRRWVFRSWSNGGPQEQELVVPEEAVDRGLYLIAQYELLSRLTIESTPPGVVMEVDGTPCSTPCLVDRPSGTPVRLRAPAIVAVSEWERYEFTGWGDGEERERTVTLSGTEVLRLVAQYERKYRLELKSHPVDGGVIESLPASSDGFYPAGLKVLVRAKPSATYRFRRWAGDLESAYSEAVVELDRPKSVVAYFEHQPETPMAEVVNAASLKIGEPVAPGSLITIFGADLASGVETVADGGLPQTLAGVSVTVSERVLALLYASPDQINAWLPPDLPEGDYELTVYRLGRGWVKGRIRVARNAPGLFFRLVDGHPWAVAVSEEGSVITPEMPAKPGAWVTLFATGIGPLEPSPPYGFPCPLGRRFQSVDLVEAWSRDRQLEVRQVIAAAGLYGVQAVEVRMPEEAAGSVEVQLRVNGTTSNPVLVPVR